MIDRIVIFIGSKKDFNNLLETEIPENEESVPFMGLVQYYNKKIRPQDNADNGIQTDKKVDVANCVVKSDDYGSVMEHVISNFVNIVTLNNSVGTLFVHNPPKRVIDSVKTLYSDIIEYKYSEYKKIDRDCLKQIDTTLNNEILGQEYCKKQIVSGIYKLMAKKVAKPIVLLLYGPSGVGKTETAKIISCAMGGELQRIQFSMMQTNEAYNYVFGAEHSKSSFAKDLECRETNIILIDEFDKVNPNFYNAFYEMFDEGKLVDTNYEVDVKNCVFICTTNFNNEEEIKNVLGPAMFSRMGDCIKYNELGKEQKIEIIKRWYQEILERLKKDEKTEIEKTAILSWFIENIDRYDNIRILKTKLENAIFEKLVEKFIINIKGEN